MSSSDASHSQKLNILLANDDIQSLIQTAKLFKTQFGSVFGAENGLEAFVAVKERPPHFFDAILLPIKMSILDGFSACERITSYLKGETLASILSMQRAHIEKAASSSQQRNSNDSSEVNSRDLPEPWNEAKRPLIFALTEDLSIHMQAKIAETDFVKGFAKITKKEVKEIAKAI